MYEIICKAYMVAEETQKNRESHMTLCPAPLYFSASLLHPHVACADARGKS
jgi:hypothetical protein